MAEDEPSKKYIEGFNTGYLLQEEKPDLALSLRHTRFPESEQDYANGLRDGISQREMEQLKEKGRSVPDKEPDKNNDPDMGR